MLAVGEQYLNEYSSLCLKMSNGFCGGLAGTHAHLCGAFSAGTMLIGALQGRLTASEDDQDCLNRIKQFREDFLRCYQTLDCQTLIDRREAQGLSSCRSYVEGTVELLIPYLN